VIGTGSVASGCGCACSGGALPEPSVWGAILGVKVSAMGARVAPPSLTTEEDERSGNNTAFK
jgi:hypothetical protein